MPFVTVKKKIEEVPEEVYHPEIKWKIDADGHEKYEGGTSYAGRSILKSEVLTVVIEQAPRNRTINYRHAFYRGNKYTQYHLQIPWTYYVARVNTKGIILLSGMFFANKELKKVDQKGLCCAPLPNNDYGVDKGLGVCLWKAGASFGKTPEDAAIKAHEYIWTSDFNPGVNYYDEGRPKEIQAEGWQGSLEKWQALTLEKKEIEWVPVKSNKLKRICETLEDAFEWLCIERDETYQ